MRRQQYYLAKEDTKKKILIKLKSNFKDDLIAYLAGIEENLAKLKIDYVNIANLPTTKKVFTFLRSPHVYKKAKIQYALKFYKCAIKIPSYAEKDFEFIQKYIIANKPSSIQIQIIFSTKN